ncbi:DUF3224 domain-containing protein [Streptomyces carminius]|uniref:DUF3224 domain-containing protein n=1 Tax=Streptomyces carminius TaxID=2665496 RepID=A0A2M8MBX4_9ACTN|nr:DUF3224 domain-containing protein [Streptomyces carminius]PJE97863.1 DUF3224 domain-containing protein [Streptomyces carminius]PJF01690.1 DUF3224 domain-containing protein [Streptomyces carminius]
MPTHTTGSFTFADWRETVLSAAEDGPRLTTTTVTNHFTGGIEAAGTACAYTTVYTTGNPASAGSFSGHELLTGTVGGRKGSFVLAERGTFDERATVRCVFEVVPGSGTGELAGLRGTGGFTAVHGEPSVPYSFEYELA